MYATSYRGFRARGFAAVIVPDAVTQNGGHDRLNSISMGFGPSPIRSCRRRLAIIYTRGWIDKVHDKRESSLWVRTRRQQEPLPGARQHARWSPSGDRIASNRAGKPRLADLRALYGCGSATTQVTRVEKAPRGVTWAPDGARLGFMMNVEAKNNWPIKMPRAPKAPRWWRAAHCRRLDYRSTAPGSTTTPIGYFVVPHGRYAAPADDGQWNHTASSGRQTASRSCSGRTASRTPNTSGANRHLL